ncbi:MAG: cytochrome b N-terminal domain-containing protein [Polyangia bacterium]
MKFRDWLEDRTGYRKIMKSALDEPVIGGASWAYVFGSGLLFLFVLQAVTGVLMALYYTPSSRESWGSVYSFTHVVPFGWFVRGLHHFGSSAMVVLLVVHMFQALLYGADRAPRELGWWTGVFLLFVSLAFCLTGYLLPWDQKGYWATGVVTSIMGTLPLVGRWIQHVVQGGNGLGNLTLTRFFGFHVFFLPTLLLSILVAHIYFFRRHGATPRWSRPKAELEAKTRPFWPGQITYDLAFSLLILAGLVWVVIAKHGAPLDAPADPASNYLARPEWYFLWLFELLKIVPGRWEGTFVLVFMLVAVCFLLALPLVDRNAVGSPRRRWRHLLAAACLGGGIAFLTFHPMVRDASDPAVRVQKEAAEKDAKEAMTLAALGIPPGGADLIYMNTSRSRGAHVFVHECQPCHKGPDGIGGASAPDLQHLMTTEWVRGLIADPTKPEYFGATALAGMPPTTASPADLATLTSYVRSLGGRESEPPTGKKLFEDTGCHGCHALSGEDPLVGPSLGDYGSSAWLAGVILHPDAAQRYGAQSTMPAYAGKLTDEDVTDLETYLLPAVAKPAKSAQPAQPALPAQKEKQP